MTKDVLKLKRYKNRKIYNTEDHAYTSLSKLNELVKSGREIQILDNDTNEDLTTKTLFDLLYINNKVLVEEYIKKLHLLVKEGLFHD